MEEEKSIEDWEAEEETHVVVQPPRERRQQPRRAASAHAHRASLLFFANPAAAEGQLGGLYGYAIVRATDVRYQKGSWSRWWSAVWAPLAISALLLVQILIMVLIAVESSHPSCLEHDDCRVGEFCTNFFSKRPVCDDCEDLKLAEELGLTEEILNEAMNHCYNNPNGNDEMPGMCDHLDKNIRLMQLSASIVLAFVAVLFALETLIDIDQEAQDQRLWAYQRAKISSSSGRPLPWAVRFVVWNNHIFRLFLLPAFSVSAVLSLILREPITAQNLLLNGLAVTFANQLDQLLGNFFLTPVHWGRLNDAVKEMMLSDDEGTIGSAMQRSGLSMESLEKARRKSSRIWIFNRAYAVILVLVIVMGVFYVRPLASFFAHPAGTGPLCGNIVDMVAIWPLVVICGGVLPVYYILFCQDRWLPSNQSSGGCHQALRYFRCFTSVTLDAGVIVGVIFFCEYVIVNIVFGA